MTTTGLSTWIMTNAIPIIVLMIGAFMLFLAKSGSISRIVTMLVCVLIAFAVIAMATPGIQSQLGTWMTGLFGVSG